MKCKLSFPVKGDVKFPFSTIFKKEDKEYQFVLEDNYLKEISITIDNHPESCMPTIENNEDAEIKTFLTIPSIPYWDDIVSDIRTFEGALSIWGVREINIEEHEIVWIPESDSDKEKMQLYSFQIKKNKMKKEDDYMDPLDMFIRTILGAEELRVEEIPMNFYRRGRNNLFEERYIDAIYDFFFVIENLFAGGEFKQKKVIQKLTSCNELLLAIDDMKSDPKDYKVNYDRKINAEFTQKYIEKENKNIIKEMVKMRGFL
ncbi:hypothetical protein ACFL6W_07935, partial [Thermodesulfobacteriota bacterium]